MNPNLILHMLHKYRAIITVNWRNRVTYITDLFSQAPLVILRIWIFHQLYTVTYASSYQTYIESLSLSTTTWILALMQACSFSIVPLISQSVEEDIHSGSFAFSVSKPYSYGLFQLCSFIGRTLPSLCVNATVASCTAFLLVGHPYLHLSNLLCALVLLIGGFILYFFIHYTLGLCAFWVKDTMPLIWLYWKGETLFGGFFIPLIMLPSTIYKLALMLPFAHIFYSAFFMLFNGSIYTFALYASIQWLWIIIWITLAHLIFKKGVNRVFIEGN